MLLFRPRAGATRRPSKVRLSVQQLENRCLLSVQAVSLADPSLYATGAIGGLFVEGHSLSADGRYVLFMGGDNIVPGDHNLTNDVFVRDLQTGKVTLVSVTSAGTSGNAASYPDAITPDGRYVLFYSSATDLVSGVHNGQSNLFVRDLVAGTTTLVNVNSSATGVSSGGAYDAVMTPDGRYVAFRSYARDLVSGDNSYGIEVYLRDLVNQTTVLVSTGQGTGTYIATSGPEISDDGRDVIFQSAQTYSFATRDIYVRDVVAGTTAMVSVNSTGTGGGNYDSSNAVIAAGGRYVAFVSLASNLVAGSTPTSFQVYRRDLQTQTTSLVSTNYQGGLPNGSSGVNGWANPENPSLSADGRYVAFTSDATNLTATAPPIQPNVFVRDMTAGQTTQVSIANNGAEPNWYSEHPFISADGHSVGFFSYAWNLTSQTDSPNGEDLFVRNLTAGTTTLIDVTSDGKAAANMQPTAPSITPDGSHVAFNSPSDALVTSDGDRSWDVFVRDLNAGTTTLVSYRDPTLPSLTANGNSYLPPVASHANAISADGRYVTFTSDASNLVPGDNNNNLDVFVGDRTTGAVTLVSVNQAGTGSGNSFSQRPAMSADGRYVAFDSLASDLTSISDTNSTSDVFVRDLQTGTTTLVTINGAGTAAADAGGTEPVLSPDGRYVLFRSDASDLLPNMDLAGAYYNIYLRDLQTDTTYLVSASADGTGGGNSHSSNAVFTPDGRYVVFQSYASNLVANDTNGQMDVFAWDLQTHATTLVSVNSSGTDSGNGTSQNPVISADGRYVAFESTAPDLVANDNNNASDVFVRDLQTGTTTLVSIDSAGTGSGGGASQNASISADGHYVAFDSMAPDLVANDTNGHSDVFIRDLQTGATTLVSVNGTGTGSGNDDSQAPLLSTDGSTVVFSSNASDLVASDLNGAGPGRTNAFLRNLNTGTTVILDNHPAGGYLLEPDYALSADNQHVAFTAAGDDLTPGDYNDFEDTFVWSNAPPAANPGGPYSVAEGSSVVLDGSGSSDPDGTIVRYEWDYNYDGVTFHTDATGATPTFSAATLDGPATRTVALRVTDELGGTSLATATVTILNVPPTSGVTGASSGVRGQPRTFTFTAQDPSPADQAAGFTYAIDWGDGTTATLTGPGSVAVDHGFTAAGSFTVRVSATDKDGGQSTSVSTNISIVSAALQGSDLIVGGTTANDTISVAPADTAGNLTVIINRVVVGTFQPTGQIVVYAQAGADKVLLQSKKIGTTVVYVTVPAILFGGDGNDILSATGDTANNVLVGGAGNDSLTGGRGRDILIGDLGADTLHGGAGQDIVIAGTTDNDNSLAALMALRQEWGRTDLSYQDRINHLDGNASGGLNGAYLLNAMTVHDDAAIDQLYGGADTDWFFAQLSGTFQDVLGDHKTGEIITGIS